MKNRSTTRILLLTALTGLWLTGTAAVINWDGNVYLTDTSEQFPWVGDSYMYEDLQNGDASATEQSGFAYFETHAIADLNWTFGDLELTSKLSPGISSPGFEIYAENDASTQPFNIYLGTNLLASGVVDYLRSDVDHKQDYAATGTAEVTLNDSVTGNDFYDEVMTLSDGTGKLFMNISNFNPVDGQGHFQSTGTLSVVPEPTTATLFFAALLPLFWLRKTRLFRQVPDI